MEQLEQELVELICGTCKIPVPPVAEIDREAEVIGSNSQFGLDSLDSVELVAVLQKEYGVRIGSEQSARDIMKTLHGLADFIRENRQDL